MASFWVTRRATSTCTGTSPTHLQTQRHIINTPSQVHHQHTFIGMYIINTPSQARRQHTFRLTGTSSTHLHRYITNTPSQVHHQHTFTVHHQHTFTGTSPTHLQTQRHILNTRSQVHHQHTFTGTSSTHLHRHVRHQQENINTGGHKKKKLYFIITFGKFGLPYLCKATATARAALTQSYKCMLVLVGFFHNPHTHACTQQHTRMHTHA